MWNEHENSKLEVVPELKILQDHLLANCLCTLPPNVPPTLLHRVFSEVVSQSNITAVWSVDQILLQITCVQLISEKVIKQSTNTSRCRTLVDLHDDLIRRQNDVIEYLMLLADDSDQYIRFSAARALAIFFLILKTRLKRTWLDKLVDNLRDFSQSHCILFSLHVLKRIIEWKDFKEHILENGLPEDELPPPSCHILSMRTEWLDSTSLKCWCIESLTPKWTQIVNQFSMLILNNALATNIYQSCIISFLNLWEAIVSVKANLSIFDTKPFYCSFDLLISLLSTKTSPLIWKHILNLLNEVLCYGSTLALQHDLAGEPCSLALEIVKNVKKNVKDECFLRTFPDINGNDNFGGNDCKTDILLEKIVLLVLKAIAVTVKEAKYDASSDSSASSEHEDEECDMDIICRSILNVLTELDTFVKKKKKDFHPGTIPATWIVRLFMEQDDYLIESMVCCVDVARVLCYRNNFLPELRTDLNPSETFLTFVNAISFNTDLLVDYLKSNETCFLLYILKFLKYVRDNWGEFINTCRYELQAVGKLFSDLRTTIDREVRNKQITYNINPVLTLLADCEVRLRIK